MNIHYLCPLCNLGLSREGNSYYCANKHCFDIAKEGYVNLLPVQNKKSKNPGDNALMVQARRQFLQRAYYQNFCKKIISTIKETRKNTKSVLDIGCGNGWYAEQIQNELNNPETHGIDISKHAVKAAAKSRKENTYSVASAYSLPYPDNSFDLAICIFSPADLKEVQRILKPGGIFVYAEPGQDHLKELAAIIYKEVQAHKGSPLDYAECSELEEYLCTLHKEYCLIEQQDLPNLLAMTPYYWSTSEEQKKEIENLDKLEVQLDFKITCISKKKLS